jgi:hypothetical protein
MGEKVKVINEKMQTKKTEIKTNLLNNGYSEEDAEATTTLFETQFNNMMKHTDGSVSSLKIMNDFIDSFNIKGEETEDGGDGNVAQLNQPMYKNKRTDIKDFVDYTLNPPKEKLERQKQNNKNKKGSSFIEYKTQDDIVLNINSEVIKHDNSKHKETAEDWENVLNNLNNDNIVEAMAVGKKMYGEETLLKVKDDNNFYYLTIAKAKGRNVITTLFKTTKKEIDAYIKDKYGSPQSPESDKSELAYIRKVPAIEIINDLKNNVNIQNKKNFNSDDPLGIR